MAAWPDSHIGVLLHYLDRVPAPEEQATQLLAQLCVMYAGVHREKGARAPTPADFMPWLKAFQPEAAADPQDRYSDSDLSLFAALGMRFH